MAIEYGEEKNPVPVITLAFEPSMFALYIVPEKNPVSIQ